MMLAERRRTAFGARHSLQIEIHIAAGRQCLQRVRHRQLDAPDDPKVGIVAESQDVARNSSYVGGPATPCFGACEPGKVRPQRPWTDYSVLRTSQLAYARGRPSGVRRRCAASSQRSEMRSCEATSARLACYALGSPSTGCRSLNGFEACLFFHGR